MDLDTRLQKVSVIGAAGKMGSGISLLLAREMANSWMNNSVSGDTSYKLVLMDTNPQALEGLQKYLSKQIVKYASKSLDKIKTAYSSKENSTPSDEDICNWYTQKALNMCEFVTDLCQVGDSHMVFEAIIENADIKTKVYRQIASTANPNTYYFTNTSSIPIQLIDKQADLKGNIIGFHFYNPPAIQKLVEVISSPDTRSDLIEIATQLGERMRKILVPANDIAGFIGNGHFIRDGLFGMEEASRIQAFHADHECLYVINNITQNYLIRPMGIFQLIDYVGIDVFKLITTTMSEHLNQNFDHPFLNEMIEQKVLGGQNSDGSQKDGFLKYENGLPTAVYSLSQGKYISFAENDWKDTIDEKLGPFPSGYQPWKNLLRNPDKDKLLTDYFKNLFNMDTVGSTLAQKYLQNSKNIGNKLVQDKVANNINDVSQVLINGFYHLYGPVNNFC